MAVTDPRRRTSVDRHAFLDYQVSCPYCGAKVGPRSVTREHLDILKLLGVTSGVVARTKKPREVTAAFVGVADGHEGAEVGSAWAIRRGFPGLFGQARRQILVDHARARVAHSRTELRIALPRSVVSQQ